MGNLSDIFIKEKHLTVIEASDIRIKILCAAVSKSSVKILNAVSQDIRDKTDQELSKIIPQIIKTDSLDPGNLILSICRSMLVVRSVELPSSKDEEIKSMLGFQVSKILPFDLKDVVYDFYVAKKKKEGTSNIIITLVKDELLKKSLKLLGNNSGSLKAVSFSSVGLLNLYLKYKAHKAQHGAVVLLNIDSDCGDFCVVEAGELVFTRSISFGKDEYIGKLIEEVKLSINTYLKESGAHDASISEIFIFDNFSDIEVLVDLFKKEFNKPVTIINWYKFVGFSDKVMDKSQVQPYCSAIGMLFANNNFKVNLLPESLKVNLKTKVRIKESVEIWGLLILAALLVFSIFMKTILEKKKQISNLNKKISELSKPAMFVEKAQSQIDAIKAHLVGSTLSLDVLREVYRITPPGIALNIYSYEDGKYVTLKGQAQDLSGVFSYVNELEKSELFDNVKVKYATKRKAYDKDMADFEINCPINPAGVK